MNKAIVFALCAMAFAPLAELARAGEPVDDSLILLAQADAASEQADWEKIVNSTNPDDFLDFITKYPEGIFRSTAEAQIKRLYLHTGSGPATQANPPAAASADPDPQPTAPATAQPAIRQVVPNGPATPTQPAATVQQAQPATPTPAQQPAAATTNADSLSPAAQQVLALRMDTQRELARVGCFGGTVDGRWDMRSSEALRIYARKKGIVLPSWDPTQDVLERLIIERGEICSAPACLVTEVSRNGQCVEKACPVGEQLSSDGRCRTASEAAAEPAPPPRQPTAEAAPAQPAAVPLRPAAPAAEPVARQPAAEPAPRAIERRAAPERRAIEEPRRKRIEPAPRPVRKAAKKPVRVEVVRPQRERAAPQKRRARAPCSAAVKGLPEYDYCE